jgi:hypothetical protein
MVLADWSEKVSDPEYVILDGDNGPYATKKVNLDSRLTDPHRYTLAEELAALLRRVLPSAKVTVLEEKIQLA